MTNKHKKVWKVVSRKPLSGKQISQKEKHFPRNQTKFFFDGKVFFVDRKVFPLTGKCFPLTNFSNDKQIQESLESGFPENEFQETNMAKETVLYIYIYCIIFSIFFCYRAKLKKSPNYYPQHQPTLSLTINSNYYTL